MTIRKKPIALQEQARLWLNHYENSSNPDTNHPAVHVLRSLAETGLLLNTSTPAVDDLLLQAYALSIRSSGKSYEEAVEILATSTGMSESTIGRRIKRKTAVPPEIQALTGNDSVMKIMFHAAQIKLRSKRHKD